MPRISIPAKLGQLLTIMMMVTLPGHVALGAADTAPAIQGVERHAGVVYGKAGGEPLLMDLYVPVTATRESPAAWLIRFSSDIEKPDKVGLALLERGYALAYASYLGKSQLAPYPPFPQLPEAPKQAVRFVRANAGKYNLDPVRMGVWGWSRGGTTAHWLAHTGWTLRFDRGEHLDQSSRVGFCVSLAGATGAVEYDLAGGDLGTWDRGEGQALTGDAKFDPLKRRAAAPYSYITPASSPVYWLKGGNDGNNVDQLTAITALKAVGVSTKWHLQERGGHGVAGGEVLAPLIVAWVDQQMKAIPADLLTRKLDLASMTESLAKAGLISQARMVLDEPGAKFGRELRELVDRREAEVLLEEVERLQLNGEPGVAYARHLERLAALQPADHALRARLVSVTQVATQRVAKGTHAGLRLAVMAQVARVQRQDGVAAAEAAIAATNAEAATLAEVRARMRAAWPGDVAVPAWAQAHGVDAFGAWVELGVGAGEKKVRQLFRYCSAGKATVGAKADAWGQIDGDSALRTVALKEGYWIGDTEVTQAFYMAIMGENPSHFRGDGRLPVEKVNFPAAMAFITKLNGAVAGLNARLPLVDEWEYACRAGEAGMFGGTGELEQMGWFLGNSGRKTQPVGSKLPNAWGIYDMHGNVWEWCGDERTTPPRHYRYYRGGSFVSSPERCRAVAVGAANMENATYYHGVRLVIPASVPATRKAP